MMQKKKPHGYLRICEWPVAKPKDEYMQYITSSGNSGRDSPPAIFSFFFSRSNFFWMRGTRVDTLWSKKSQIKQIAFAWSYKGARCLYQAVEWTGRHTGGSSPSSVCNAEVQTDNVQVRCTPLSMLFTVVTLKVNFNNADLRISGL